MQQDLTENLGKAEKEQWHLFWWHYWISCNVNCAFSDYYAASYEPHSPFSLSFSQEHDTLSLLMVLGDFQ